MVCRSHKKTITLVTVKHVSVVYFLITVDNPPCINIVLGSEEMGCKTLEEWEKIGSIQCGVRVTSQAKYYHSAKVRT